MRSFILCCDEAEERMPPETHTKVALVRLVPESDSERCTEEAAGPEGAELFQRAYEGKTCRTQGDSVCRWQ